MISPRRKQKLQYIQGMLKELEIMARMENLKMISYLIGMALIEAHDSATGQIGGQVNATTQIGT